MRYAIIENGKVVNVVDVEPEVAQAAGLVACGDDVLGGWNYDGSSFTPGRPFTDEFMSKETRIQRNELLAASDWTQVEDSPVDKQAWATYRQALRDVSKQSGFPWEVTWPTPPA